DALMVRDEHVGAPRLQLFESACGDAHAGCGQNQTRPRARAPVREVSVAIDETRDERQRAERDGVYHNARDQKEDRAPQVKRTHRVLLARGGSRGGTAGREPVAGAPGAGADCEVADGSMKRPKIIFPAVVCNTLVTTTSMVL